MLMPLESRTLPRVRELKLGSLGGKPNDTRRTLPRVRELKLRGYYKH